MPASSPASRPTFSSLCTHTPTSSSSGCATIPRIASWPTIPVAHWMTRYVMVPPFRHSERTVGSRATIEPEPAEASATQRAPARRRGTSGAADMHDLVIRNGTVVDGTGAPRVAGDVAITDGIITAVGAVDEHGAREI